MERNPTGMISRSICKRTFTCIVSILVITLIQLQSTIQFDQLLGEHVSYKEKDEFDSLNNQTLWMPLSSEEKIKFTNQDLSAIQYDHCQYGQGRAIDSRCDIDNMSWKWNEERSGSQRLSTLTDVLDYMEERKKSPNESCNILFVGDSLSGDHAMAAQCQLASVGYTATSCLTPITSQSKDSYGKDVNVTCRNQDYYFQHFVLEKKVATSCQKVVIMFLTPGRNDKVFIDQLHRLAKRREFVNGVVMIYSWGTHCNERETCLRPKIEKSFIPLLDDQQLSNWTILFRDSEPQHWSTPDGTYLPGIKKCSRATVKASNWRNEEVYETLRDHNVTSKVPIVPIFEALEPLSWLHDEQDCTHYCYSPFRFDVTWDGTLNALRKYDGLPYQYKAVVDTKKYSSEKII